jgi:hypothetical protein
VDPSAFKISNHEWHEYARIQGRKKFVAPSWFRVDAWFSLGPGSRLGQVIRGSVVCLFVVSKLTLLRDTTDEIPTYRLHGEGRVWRGILSLRDPAALPGRLGHPTNRFVLALAGPAPFIGCAASRLSSMTKEELAGSL